MATWTTIGEIGIDMSIQTGYFANSKKSLTRCTKVHLVEDGKPMCGARVDPQSEFLWCANGIESLYIDCYHCAVIAFKKLSERGVINFYFPAIVANAIRRAFEKTRA
jgi:hypothetical protein